MRKSMVMTATLVVGLVLGIVFGPSVRSTIVSAQTQPPAQAPASPQASPAPQGQAPAQANNLRNSFLDNLAAALNIQRSALDSAITSAGNTTVDQAVQQGTLTQAQADAIKARIQAGDTGALWAGRGGKHGGARANSAVHQTMLEAAAKALNLSTADLMTQLRSGQTLAQLAQANNTTEQAVVSAAQAAAKTQLDQQVASGTLTQAQADAIYAKIQQAGAAALTPRGRGFGGRGPKDGSTTPQAPSTAPSTAPTSDL